METTYKLMYFDMKGRGELARLIFAAAGVEYEDFRIQFSEWPALKKSMPFEQIPVLEVNGKKFAQSLAICKFLANKFGLNGETHEDIFEVDQIIELRQEFTCLIDTSFKQTDPERKAALMREAIQVDSLTYLERFEHMIEESESGFFVGAKLTLADLSVFDLIDWLEDRHQGILKEFPHLQSFNHKIANLDRICSYIEKRRK